MIFWAQGLPFDFSVTQLLSGSLPVVFGWLEGLA
jgi:hypothetical protein